MSEIVLLHRLFEQQALRSPENIALIDGAQTLTYQQLNHAANQLARYWQGQGLGSGDIVAIGLPHSCALVTAMLASLKIGAAWLALDLNAPVARLRSLLEDANARLLVSDAHHAAQTLAGLPTPLFLLTWDGAWNASVPDNLGCENLGCENLAIEIAPDAMAYLVYTSGSTGKSKGVVGTHVGMCNRLHWMWQRYPYAPHERCCAKTPLGFVDAVAEIFSPLCWGIPLYMFGVAATQQLDQFVLLLATHRITRLVLVPSLLDTLLTITPDLAQRLPDLRCWVVSGETVSKRLVQAFFTALPDVTLINLYGSSEVAADATFYQIMPSDASSQATAIPIGQPISNMQVWVLDEHMQPVAKGVVGEIYISGIGLAQGYLNQPELSQQVFIQAPFVLRSRLYKTGDLGAWRSDGELLFHGRSDQQIKINGRRIELGEIEATLLTCSGIAGAAVKYWQHETRHGLLVAYIVFKNAASRLTNRAIRAFLANTLPLYMVPAQIIVLPSLPLNVNGKIDRLALPAPSPTGMVPDAVAPDETEMCACLIGVLSSLLSGLLSGVSAAAPSGAMVLAELGIDSLVFAHMRSAIFNAHGVTISFRDVFQAETIQQLADCIAQRKAQAGSQTGPQAVEQAILAMQEAAPDLPNLPNQIQTISYSELANTLNLACQPWLDPANGIVYYLFEASNGAAAIALTTEIFAESEPLCVHLGLNASEMKAMFSPLFERAMAAGLSLVALQNQQVVGATIALDKASMAQLPAPDDPHLQQKFDPVFDILAAPHQVNEVQMSGVVSQFMTVVQADCMGLGIGYTLEKLAVVLAMQQGYTCIESELTSGVSQTLARQLGYELGPLHRYDSFVDRFGARPFQGLPGGVQLGVLHF